MAISHLLKKSGTTVGWQPIASKSASDSYCTKASTTVVNWQSGSTARTVLAKTTANEVGWTSLTFSSDPPPPTGSRTENWMGNWFPYTYRYGRNLNIYGSTVYLGNNSFIFDMDISVGLISYDGTNFCVIAGGITPNATNLRYRTRDHLINGTIYGYNIYSQTYEVYSHTVTFGTWDSSNHLIPTTITISGIKGGLFHNTSNDDIFNGEISLYFSSDGEIFDFLCRSVDGQTEYRNYSETYVSGSKGLNLTSTSGKYIYTNWSGSTIANWSYPTTLPTMASRNYSLVFSTSFSIVNTFFTSYSTNTAS